MKSVIVTGANGFVGSNIVTVLMEQGWYVYAVDLSFDNPAVATWDINKVQCITSSCADLPAIKADALIHGAYITASPEARNESPEDNIRANIEPMLSMMDYAQQNHITRSIYLSSSGVYRYMPDTVISEDRPQQPSGTYAVAKTMMEQLVETMKTVYGRDIICVRLGNIYGQNEYQRPSRPYLSVIGEMIHMALHNHKIIVYRPAEIREWTFASDIGKAIHRLLSAERLQYALYHVASGERKSNLEIAYQIQSIVDDAEITIQDPQHAPKPSLTRLGILDNTRLLADTQFDEWTPLSKGLLAPILVSKLRSKANA